MIVEVECGPGHHGEPMPRLLSMGARRVELVEIVDWWPGADHRYFKAKGEDGARYILRHDLARDVWELTMYEKAAYGEAEAEEAGQRGESQARSPV